MSDLRAAIEKVLDEHERLSGFRDMSIHCTCGWVSEPRQGITYHRAHVADAVLAVVQEALAKAWDSTTPRDAEAEFDEWDRNTPESFWDVAAWPRQKPGGIEPSVIFGISLDVADRRRIWLAGWEARGKHPGTEAKDTDLFTGRFEEGDRVVYGHLPDDLAVYTVESIHPGGLRLSRDGEIYEARVESLGFFGPDLGEVFAIRDLWLAQAEKQQGDVDRGEREERAGHDEVVSSHTDKSTPKEGP